MLFENHYMNIKKIDKFFYPNLKNKNIFIDHVQMPFQKLNIMIILNFVKQIKQ